MKNSKITKISFKILAITVLVFSLFTPLLLGNSAFAESGAGNTSGGQCKDVDSNMLSFPTWYRGLCENGLIKFKEDFGANFVIIAFNLIDIILRVSSMVAVGFILYGGFQYMISSGVPASIAKAKATIIYAITGLLVSMFSAAVVSLIVSRMS